MKKVWNWFYRSYAVAALFMLLPFWLARYFYPDDEQAYFYFAIFSYFSVWLMFVWLIPKIDDLVNKRYINLEIKK